MTKIIFFSFLFFFSFSSFFFYFLQRLQNSLLIATMTISFSSSSSNIVAIWSRDVYRFLLHMIFFILVRVEIIFEKKKNNEQDKF
jgi:hypothetical protein